MKEIELVAPCHFGMESVLKREITDLGYEIKKVEDGRVTFLGGEDAVCRSNLFLRTAERVLWKVGSFYAKTFEQLFDGIKSLPWEQYIPKDGKFWVKKASSVKSRLFSLSDIQSITKKAIVERLKGKYHVEWFSEEGAEYPVRIFLIKDEVSVYFDTSGEHLHKRGYRQLTSKAPITETLAASLILLSYWKKDRILVDPFCGSGTFPIEAAMIAANIAPGMKRSFAAEQWKNLIKEKEWKAAKEEADDRVDYTVQTDIQGYDIDGAVIKAARQNARHAGVEKMIHLQQRPVSAFNHPKKYGFVITNPPYGERMEEKENLPKLYRQIGEALGRLDTWSFYVITSYEDVERYIGKKADKNRKIYNGMLRAYYYQFLGPKPPKMQEKNTNWTRQKLHEVEKTETN